ncbi:MAG: DUF1894 domain-containing protein [Methanoregula sp.]|nr:DUF1894 domain-containing protein [Methanoregula sp.]
MEQPARCIRHMCSDTILKEVTGRKVNNYIRKHCCEHYLMHPGFEFRGIAIQLKSPMLVGLLPESLTILLPFTKPCYGTMLYEINADDEDFTDIRSALGGENTLGKKTGKLNRKQSH